MLSSAEGLESKTDGKKTRCEATAVIETRTDSDLNCNLSVEMEGSGLIQKSTRPSDWMDVRD